MTTLSQKSHITKIKQTLHIQFRPSSHDDSACKDLVRKMLARIEEQRLHDRLEDVMMQPHTEGLLFTPQAREMLFHQPDSRSALATRAPAGQQRADPVANLRGPALSKCGSAADAKSRHSDQAGCNLLCTHASLAKSQVRSSSTGKHSSGACRLETTPFWRTCAARYAACMKVFLPLPVPERHAALAPCGNRRSGSAIQC